MTIAEPLARLRPEVLPAFARSETFHPRYGWLKKGFDAAAEAPDVFLRSDATTLLGVGKNMVRAIRYWCLAYKVLEERPNADQPRLRDAVPTPFGHALLPDEGWDPFIEDPASLWLLHWQLLRPPSLAPAWYAVFNHSDTRELNDDLVLASLRSFCDKRSELGDVADNSLRKDTRCLMRMYANVTAGRDLLEDTIDSPFSELELIRAVPGERHHYVFNFGPKRTLPDTVIVYACLDFVALKQTTATLTTLSRLTQATGSPGKAFKLSEDALAEAIERYSAKHSLVRLTHAAGARQLIVEGDPARAAEEALRRHYRGTR